jgi:hypothetical protein
MASSDRLHIDKQQLKQKFNVSHFDLNAIIRGMQLTLVGGQSSFPPLPEKMREHSD